MNLPVLSQLRDDLSTYITFTKSLTDYDSAIANNTVCYFSKVVALNLPNWSAGSFYKNLSSVDVTSDNPNICMPKMIQYYMENIMRQSITNGEDSVPEIAELAFWKMLNALGMSNEQVRDSVTFVNSVATSNFVEISNNQGWGEIVCQIPNSCNTLVKAWKTLDTVASIVQSDDDDTALYDNGDKQFLFDDEFKQVFDFDSISYKSSEEGSFDFNCLLLFYVDADGVNKLHGINFIYPYENKVSYWDLEKFTQKTNTIQTVGYQFKFIQKTCNNEATQLYVEELQQNTHWNVFAETVGKLNTFLDLKIKESESTIVDS